MTNPSLTADAKKLAKPSARIAANHQKDTKLNSPDNQRSAPWQTDGQQHNLVLSTHGVAQNIVYYQTNTTGNVDQALTAAINAWNNLGVIQLVKTNDATLSAIQVNSQNTNPNISVNLRPSASYYGGENHLANALVNVPGNIRQSQTTTFSQTLTQTIGKALGFNVDNNIDSNNQPDIMNENLAQYHGNIELGIRQVSALKQHYQINA